MPANVARAREIASEVAMERVARPSVSTAHHFINGEFVLSKSGATFEAVDPATEELTTRAARGDAQDVAAAVSAAKQAFDDGGWSRAKPSFRRKVLFQVADLIETRSGEITQLQSLEMGGPIGPPMRGPHPMVERSAWNFRFFAEEQELAGSESFNRDDSLLTGRSFDSPAPRKSGPIAPREAI
jgi:5-carboxymethyl-2-hydroxymuconic-semialdehyde dehydrogenase